MDVNTRNRNMCETNNNNWSNQETTFLVKAYVDLVHNLQVNYDRSTVFKLLAEDLRSKNIHKTDVQCKDQVNSVLGRRNAIVIAQK